MAINNIEIWQDLIARSIIERAHHNLVLGKEHFNPKSTEQLDDEHKGDLGLLFKEAEEGILADGRARDTIITKKHAAAVAAIDGKVLSRATDARNELLDHNWKDQNSENLPGPSNVDGSTFVSLLKRKHQALFKIKIQDQGVLSESDINRHKAAQNELFFQELKGYVLTYNSYNNSSYASIESETSLKTAFLEIAKADPKYTAKWAEIEGDADAETKFLAHILHETQLEEEHLKAKERMMQKSWIGREIFSFGCAFGMSGYTWILLSGMLGNSLAVLALAPSILIGLVVYRVNTWVSINALGLLLNKLFNQEKNAMTPWINRLQEFLTHPAKSTGNFLKKLFQPTTILSLVAGSTLGALTYVATRAIIRATYYQFTDWFGGGIGSVITDASGIGFFANDLMLVVTLFAVPLSILYGLAFAGLCVEHWDKSSHKFHDKLLKAAQINGIKVGKALLSFGVFAALTLFGLVTTMLAGADPIQVFYSLFIGSGSAEILSIFTTAVLGFVGAIGFYYTGAERTVLNIIRNYNGIRDNINVDSVPFKWKLGFSAFAAMATFGAALGITSVFHSTIFAANSLLVMGMIAVLAGVAFFFSSATHRILDFFSRFGDASDADKKLTELRTFRTSDPVGLTQGLDYSAQIEAHQSAQQQKKGWFPKLLDTIKPFKIMDRYQMTSVAINGAGNGPVAAIGALEAGLGTIGNAAFAGSAFASATSASVAANSDGSKPLVEHSEQAKFTGKMRTDIAQVAPEAVRADLHTLSEDRKGSWRGPSFGSDSQETKLSANHHLSELSEMTQIDSVTNRPERGLVEITDGTKTLTFSYAELAASQKGRLGYRANNVRDALQGVEGADEIRARIGTR